MSETFLFKPSSFAMYFDELKPSMSFDSPGRTITESDVVLFSHLTGDRHPVHTDAAWAASSAFGSRIANGLLVLSYAFGLLPLDPERVIAMRRVNEATFKRPVYLGDTISVHGEIIDLREINAASGRVKCSLDIRNQNGQRTTSAAVELIWRRDCADAE
ncbi:MAG: MaoC/PaaZ C-terminal domain-containing protein [Solirubrobacterales bacterium]